MPRLFGHTVYQIKRERLCCCKKRGPDMYTCVEVKSHLKNFGPSQIQEEIYIFEMANMTL